jgi:hypothetical protein
VKSLRSDSAGKKFSGSFFMGETETKKYDSLPTLSIKGLEIFASGTYNGDTYSDADLDAMVSAFGQVGFEPTIKAGHADGQESEKEARKVFGAPALGYVDRIYRQGTKLLADLKDIPRKFADLIKAGAYKRISSEVYWGYKNGGNTYPRVLKAVAFLGADIPAITSLKAVESLYKQSDTGAIYAFDSNDNEFHVYDYPCEMPMVAGRKLDKQTAKYSENGGADGESCGDCRFYQGSQCSIVEGTIDYNGTCDMQKPRPGMIADMADDDSDKDITSYDLDGQVVEAKNNFIRKKGGEYCVVSHSGKNLGCHATREEALAQLKAVEANKNSDKQESKKNSGGDMTEQEVQDLLKNHTEKMYKEFEDRIHKAREEGKEEANKENDMLREDIRKLQLEKRSERIEHWLKAMKDQGKLLPAEESKVRSLRQWMPDEGPELKYFAIKDGKTSEFSAGPAEMFEELFSKRQSLFTTYSRNDEEEDDGQVLPDPSAEVDRRAKSYQAKMTKENKTVGYRDALNYVLKASPELAQRYRDRTHLN